MAAQVAIEEAAAETAAKPTFAKACCEEDLYSSTSKFQRWARSRCFKSAILMVTVLLFVWMGIDCDFNDGNPSSMPFIVVPWLFIMFYSFELCVRLMAFRYKGNALKCLRFKLDILLLLALILASCLPTDSNVSLRHLGVLLRLAQFARAGPLISAVPELSILFKGLFTACRSIFFCVLAFMLLIYLFAICFRHIAADTHLSDVLFPSVPQSMWTLWTCGVLTGSPGDVMQQLNEDIGGWAAFLFVLFFLMSFSILVVMAGVLCEVVSTVAGMEKGKIINAYMVEALHSAQCPPGFWTSKDGFLSGLQAEPGRILQHFGIDIEELAEFANFLFADGGFPSLDKLAWEIASIALPGSDRDNIRKDIRRDIMRLERRLRSPPPPGTSE